MFSVHIWRKKPFSNKYSGKSSRVVQFTYVHNHVNDNNLYYIFFFCTANVESGPQSAGIAKIPFVHRSQPWKNKER